MRRQFTLCIFAALTLLAGSVFAADLLSSLSKGDKPGGPDNGGTDVQVLDCSGAVEITLNNSYNGTNVGAPNNVTTYSCSPWSESGGEVVYHLFLAAPTMFQASITTAGCDLDLAVLDACDENAGCLIVVDSGVITNVPVSGDFYFVVDGYQGAACAFTFEIEEIVVEPIDYCGKTEDLECRDQPISGNTCDSANLIGSANTCTAYTDNGFEHYYAITLLPGGVFNASVTMPLQDAALHLFDSCLEPLNCLDGADDTFTGQAESVSYMNTSLVPEIIYLVVDSWGTDTCGDYSGTITCIQGVVSVEEVRWGDVKTRYRN